MKHMGRLAAGVLLATAVFASQAAADIETGRALFLEHCMRCHGVLGTDPESWSPHALLTPAVVLPQGPRLSDIYGRPAGIIDTFGYSRSFLAALDNPWIWDEDTLDGWITNSQQFITGTTMYVQVAEEAARTEIISYLRHFAPYIPE